jgi:hypothetical protein
VAAKALRDYTALTRAGECKHGGFHNETAAKIFHALTESRERTNGHEYKHAHAHAHAN